jgi:hypothetical protein
MLREVRNAEFVPAGGPWRRRRRLQAGRTPITEPIPARSWRAHAALQLEHPVLMTDAGARRWWWFRDRIYWEDEGLEADDVRALALEREHRRARALQRAHALLHAGAAEPLTAAGRRQGITLAVKHAVWERCGGRCAECGSAQLLEFDHVIPLALGGSSTERNMQLLCADCNRAKGASL